MPVAPSPTGAQLAAIAHPAGPLLIVGGPGTGKTSTLVERFAWLTAEADPPVAPESILVLTYSSPGADDLRERLEAAYAASPVVAVLPDGLAPELGRVQGTDAAEVALFEDRATGRAIVICALDNLGKGAAGQAVQNANLVLGFEETAGLRLAGVLV